jgi:PAS domain S-box-containing protein
MPRLATPVAKPRATDTIRARAARPRTSNRRRRVAVHTESLRPADFALGPLFAHTRDAVVVGNVDTDRIVLWNPAAERLFDRKAADAVGQSMSALISPAIVPLHRASVGLFRAASSEPVRPYEVAVARRDGSELRLELMLVPLEYQHAPERYVMILGREVPEAPSVDAAPDASEPSTNDPSNTFELHLQRINLVPLVSGVVARARTRNTLHKFNTAVPQGLTATVDPQLIEQVLEMLIEQASARCPGGCWIDVDLRRPLTGQARLEVRDFGRPLDDNGRRALADGGQSEPRLIIEQHGGTLSYEFPADGGVRAVVTLPTQRGRAPTG